MLPPSLGGRPEQEEDSIVGFLTFRDENLPDGGDRAVVLGDATVREGLVLHALLAVEHAQFPRLFETFQAKQVLLGGPRHLRAHHLKHVGDLAKEGKRRKARRK